MTKRITTSNDSHINEVYSNSRLNQFNYCPRAFYYQYRQKEPGINETKGYFLIGSLVHAGLEYALKMCRVNGQDPVANAIKGMRRYREEGITGAHIDTAESVLRAYVGLFGIGTKIVPYKHNGKSALEIELSHNYNGVTIAGTIDAIVQHEDGRVLLLDWKVRTGLLSYEDVALDSQLYIYADLARKNGIPIDAALQVQMSKKLPNSILIREEFKGHKSFAGLSAKDVIDGRTGKITRDTMDTFLETYQIPAHERLNWELELHENVIDSSDFLRYTLIDMSRIDKFIHDALLTVKDIRRNDESNEWRRITNIYNCKFCIFRRMCR